MIRSVITRLSLIILFVSGAGCSGTRYLAPGDKLYTGAEIRLESAEELTTREKRYVKSKAEDAIRPLPNKKFLGMRPKLWFYMKAGESPRGKFNKWLKRKGEEPVLISDVKPSATSEIIDAVLFNSGIFRSSTLYRVDEKKKTAEVIYTSHVHEPYHFKEVINSVSDSGITRLIVREKDESLIKPGKRYDLEILKNERIRLDDLLKNSGYFYFSPDYLVYRADTSGGERNVTLHLTLKDSIPQNAITVYRINNVDTDQEFSLSSTAGHQDTTVIGRRGGMKIRPGALARSVHLRKGEIYSRINHNNTLNRLMSMGIFKFVNVRFSDSDTSATGYLDASIMMTPVPKHTFSSEVDIISKSNSFTGPRMNLSYLDKNTFKGAEILKVNLGGSYEVQLSGENLYSYSYNPQIELSLPRFLVPFEIGANRNLIPKSRILYSYNFLKRVNYFTMRQSQFIYGFKWKENIREEHEFDPVNISYTSIKNRSEAFIELLNSNPYLKKSYEEQFIAGVSYTYTYNEQVLPDKKMQYYFQLATELSGNAFSLAKIISGKKISSETPLTVAGSIYSQYTRLSLDGRSYFTFPDNNKLAMRLFAGIAVPYGNSTSLPYTRQFFSGGPNSVRAFHINSLGPGTELQETETGFLQSGGDIKFEANAEYRFGIFRFIKGGLFTDAGNVWLLGSNPASEGGNPYTGFMRELAVGAGFGLRLDFSFVVLRFDLATPLRKPWLEESRKWVIDQINFGSSTWRRENLILNIAIGQAF